MEWGQTVSKVPSINSFHLNHSRESQGAKGAVRTETRSKEAGAIKQETSSTGNETPKPSPERNAGPLRAKLWAERRDKRAAGDLLGSRGWSSDFKSLYLQKRVYPSADLNRILRTPHCGIYTEILGSEPRLSPSVNRGEPRKHCARAAYVSGTPGELQAPKSQFTSNDDSNSSTKVLLELLGAPGAA